MQVSRGNILNTIGMLCNPNFIHSRNNQCFHLSSIYFLYPLASLPKMVKQEMPASMSRANSLFSDQINKRGMLAKLCMMQWERKRSSVQQGKPDP